MNNSQSNFLKNIFRSLKWAFKFNPLISTILALIIILSALIPLYQAKLMGDIVNQIIEILSSRNKITSAIFVLIFLYSSIYGISRILSALEIYLNKRWFMILEYKTDLAVFKKRSEIDLAQYENPKFQDLLQRAFRQDFWPLMNLSEIQFRNLANVFVILASSVVTTSLNWQVYLLVIIASIPLFYVQLKYGKITWSIWSENSSEQRMYEHLGHHLTNRTGVIQSKVLQNSRNIIQIMENIKKNFINRQISVDNKRLWGTIGASIIGMIGYGIGFYLIIHDIVVGNITIGSMVFLISALGQLVGAVSSLLSDLAHQFEWNLSVNDIFAVLDTKPYIPRKEKYTKLNLTASPVIEFKNVYFRYPETKNWVLEKLNLKIESGEKVALVGENGAGKSTLIKLLSRIYDPEKGDIFINGINLKEVDPDEWSSYLGVLLQDYLNYEFTTKESIAMGRVSHEIDLEKVKESANYSGADDFIKYWDNQYDQRIGKEFEGGVEPSKGQNQRLALARILYREGLVTVLDEPTASIDALSEMKIFDNMEGATKEMTLIVITHRFNTVKNVDKIVVLEKGMIIEEGSHDILLEKNGRYAEMYLAQAKSFIKNK